MAARRRRDRDVAGAGRAGRPVQGQRRAPPSGGGARRDPARAHAGHRHPRRGGGELEVDGRGGRTAPAARVVLAADAWTNQLLARFGRRLPLTVTKEQVTYFAAPDPAAFAPDRFPVWIWMDDPSFYGFPTYGEAGPEGGPGLRWRAGRPGRAHVRARRGGIRPRPCVPRAATCPAAVGPPIYTKTCLYTLTPDRDFVVDRLPERPGVVVAPRGRPTGSSSPRSSGASWPS